MTIFKNGVAKIFLLIFLFFPKILSAQSFVANETASTFQQIISSKGAVTKKDYDYFWSKTGIKSPQEKMNLIMAMRDSFLIIQEYNKSLWDCAERSWIAHKEIKCPELEKNLENLKKGPIFSAPKEVLAEFEKSHNGLLKTARSRGIANGTGNSDPAFSSKSLTLEQIKQTKNNIEEILRKAELILQPEFIKR